ncbi:MAG: AEC family transporter [Rhizobiaceae bacterium]|nr:AEC family transporter [Rhizobiaceae bacterium]
MLEIITLVLPFFGLILLGYVVAKFVQQPDGAMGWLNVFIIYVSLPALFYKLLANTPVEEFKRADFLATTTYVAFIIFALVFAIGYLIRRNHIGHATIQGLAGAYGNIGYMGPGMALLAFGEAAAAPVALIFCVENILHFTMAPLMMAFTGKEKTNVWALVLKVVKNIVFHPFIIATFFGVMAAIFSIDLPDAADNTINILAQAAAPCALFAMGVTLALRPLNRIPVEISYIVPIKLILFPMLTYLALSYLGNFDPIWVQVAVLLASLPTATNVFVIGQQYGYWVERASACILISTIFSVVTTSTWLWLFRTGTLPIDMFP